MKKDFKTFTAMMLDDNNSLVHYGIQGQKWGLRRYQNPDGSYTEEGKRRYGIGADGKISSAEGARLFDEDATAANHMKKTLFDRNPSFLQNELSNRAIEISDEFKDSDIGRKLLKKVFELDDKAEEYGMENDAFDIEDNPFIRPWEEAEQNYKTALAKKIYDDLTAEYGKYVVNRYANSYYYINDDNADNNEQLIKAIHGRA